MKVVAINQARMGSTRLPGKVLEDLGGKPMLGRVISRACRAELLDNAVVATTTQPADDAIISLCKEQNWVFFRGSDDDVLDRFKDLRLATEQHFRWLDNENNIDPMFLLQKAG